MRSLLLAMSLALSGWASAFAQTPKPPNILFIIVDDQSPFDLRIYNSQSILDTPNIDALARRGMVFDGAYHMGSFSGAVCMPSRHMIMSGRSLWHLPPAPFGANKSPPHLEQQTIPAVFNRADHATMRTCKLGNSYEAANKLFAVRQDASKRGGTPETGSAWHAERVLEYLDHRQANNDTRPFLIYFGFSHPHDTRDGTPELLAKYGATNHTDPDSPPALSPRQPALPANYLTGHPFDMTDATVRDEVAVSGVGKRRDQASIRNEIGRQLACSENIDIQIGRVLKKLEARGELDNTYIFYTADHGMSIGRHGLMGKQNLYEHTWRVPFVVAGPSVSRGLRVQGNIYLMDVLATLCDLAGIACPETNEGTSFRPVLEGKRDSMRPVMYGAYSGGSKPGIRCVKKDQWKLIEYEAPDRKIRETQLFDLKENPEEFMAEHARSDLVSLVGSSPARHQTNLASDPKHASKLKEMRQLLLAEMRRWDDPYRLSDQPSDDLPKIPLPEPARARRRAPQVSK
jgi:arylsulfatase A-like enzyme